MMNRATLSLLLSATFALGCGDPSQSGAEDSASVPATLAGIAAEGAVVPPTVRAQLDSGNAAYSSARYDEALRHYREAALESPDVAAPWFGIQMAATALGNQALADSARERVNDLAPGALPETHAAPLHSVPDSSR